MDAQSNNSPMKTQKRTKHVFQTTTAIVLAGLMASAANAAVLMTETFNNGTPGTPLGGDTSDGLGFWFLGGGTPGNYGGSAGSANYHPSFNSLSYMALDFPKGSLTGVETYTNYTVNIGTITFGGYQAASSVLICPRKTGTQLGFGYDFRPNSATPTSWNVYYQPAEGSTAVLIGSLDGATPTLENLQIRVRGGTMQLYTNGVPFDPAPRLTQGAPGSGEYQRALELILNTLESAHVEAIIDDITLSTPEPQAPFVDPPGGTLLAYDGFDYAHGADLNDAAGGFGWAGAYKREQNTASAFLSALSAVGESPGFTHQNLVVSGNRASLIAPGTVAPDNSRRSMRWLDIDNFPAELKTPGDMVLRVTGGRMWISLLAQRVDTSKAGFFGVSLYSNLVETVFIGKSGAAGETNWRLEGKSPNTTGLSTVNADDLALLVVLIEWNHDGTVGDDGRPVTPDKMYLWANPDLATEPDVSTAAAVSTRNVLVATQNPHLWFNRVGFRGLTSGGVLDEFRLGTTFRSVIPLPTLAIHRSGNTVVLRWKTASGVVVKQADAVGGAAWLDVSEPPVVDGDDTVVTLTVGPGEKFFRLERQ